MLPIVLYNGEARWKAAVSGLEQSRMPVDLVRVAGRLVEWLRDPRDDGLKRAFVDWVWRLAGQFEPGDAELPAVRTLEGVRMTLEERLAEWPKQWLREGREQGMREVFGRLERAGAEPAPVRTLEGVRMTLEERVAEWPKQWFREGHEQGVRKGIEQGLEHERALLRHLAASRFGAETAERLSETLAGIADPEVLTEVGGWLVRCETGSEFLDQVDRAADGADRHGDGGD